MSYDNYDLSENDPYCIEGSTCLINSLGFTDTAALNEAEQEISAIAMAELEIEPVAATFDLAHLQAIHRRLFDDVYPWAGEPRKAEISKGGKLFLPYHLIETKAAAVFADLKSEGYLAGLLPEDFSQRCGYYFGVINAIHPFREGNGRTQRILFNQLAEAAGYVIEWAAISGEQMAQACRLGRMDEPDYRPLQKLFALHTAIVEI